MRITAIRAGQPKRLSDAAAVSSAFIVNVNKFIIEGSTGNTAIAGTLGVTGLTTLNGGASPALKLNGAGSKSAGAYAGVGAAWNEAMRDEARNFELKVTDAGNITFGAEGTKKDDLIMALCYILWLGERGIAERRPRVRWL